MDEGFVLEQLHTSSTVSYAKFIRYGYPKRIDFKKLVDACKPIKSKLEKACGKSNFYSKVLLSMGLKLNEFKFGNDTIFFRSKKFHLVEEFFSDLLRVSFPEGIIEGLQITTTPSSKQNKSQPK